MAAHPDFFFSVTIDGTEYPAALTNGALLRFCELTGHDFGAVSSSAMRDNVAIVYACVESGCARQGKPFDMTLMDFADHTTPQELAVFARAMQRVSADGGGEAEAEPGAKKKHPASSGSRALP